MVSKKPLEYAKKWKVILEKTIECEDGFPEIYKNCFWIKDERLIFMTTERVMTFDEELK